MNLTDSESLADSIVVSDGPAVGKITGINHLVFLCRDMDRSVRFYRDLLGLKIVRSTPAEKGFELQYFFELGNGELFSLYQMGSTVDSPQPPVVNILWPGADGTPPPAPEKCDHLAFNVDTMEELLWFQRHLREHGVEVSEIFGEAIGTGFLPGRIYFYDPDGNPLEIATTAVDDPGWEGFDYDRWLRDCVPSAGRTYDESNEAEGS